MNITLPHTIETITGERLTFERIVVKDGVYYLEVCNEVRPEAGPPMHVHYRQDECLKVISGKMGYKVMGEPERYAETGEEHLFKAGIPHKFWNAGKDVLVCTGYISPPDNIVYFLSQIYDSINENGGRPGLYDSAFLLNRYREEYRMLELPDFVQKVIFPIVLFVGNLMGKNKKFKGAP